MKKPLTVLVVSAVAVILGLSSGFEAFVGAGEATVITCGLVVEQTINSGEQQDYSFTLQERSTVSVTWTLLAGDGRLDVLKDGALIVNGNGDGLVTLPDAEPGTYFLRFRGLGDNSQYRFEVGFLKSSLDCISAIATNLISKPVAAPDLRDRLPFRSVFVIPPLAPDAGSLLNA